MFAQRGPETITHKRVRSGFYVEVLDQTHTNFLLVSWGRLTQGRSTTGATALSSAYVRHHNATNLHVTHPAASIIPPKAKAQPSCGKGLWLSHMELLETIPPKAEWGSHSDTRALGLKAQGKQEWGEAIRRGGGPRAWGRQDGCQCGEAQTVQSQPGATAPTPWRLTLRECSWCRHANSLITHQKMARL